MAILVRTQDAARILTPTPFELEAELESILAASPGLLAHEDHGPVAFVARQVRLDDAGILDLLFVTALGLPVAVEVKLGRNGESRREVTAQVVDYVSSLTAMTVDELDNLVDGALDRALRLLVSDNELDRVWQAVGANLRAGLARMVVAIDEPPGDLVRILRFLATASQLDVQLVSVKRFRDEILGEVVVPSFLIDADSTSRLPAAPSVKVARQELAAAVDAYDRMAGPELATFGSGRQYRQIRPPNWPASLRVHYEFYQTSQCIGAELHLESDMARPLAALLVHLAGASVASGEGTLAWDAKWSSGRGRLAAWFDPDTAEASTVAAAMLDLISLTRGTVDTWLKSVDA